MSVAAVVLAAGGSSRFGKPKQLATFGGQSLVRRAIAAATAAKCAPVLVVAGEQAQEIQTEVAPSGAHVIENANWREGIASSIRAGITQLQDEQIHAVVLLACDQPLVDEAIIINLIELAASSGKPIVASSYAKTIGIPAFFDRSCFAELLALRGDSGAKKIIAARRGDVAAMEFAGGAIDIDTPADLASLRSLG